MSDAFISYSRVDRDFAIKIFDALQANGHSVWVDLTGIEPTSEWATAIYAGIEATDNFICILSPDFLTSEYCQKEVECARYYKKRFIPILYRAVDFNRVDRSISVFQSIDFQNGPRFEDSLKHLLDAIKFEYSYKSMASRLLIKAREWQVNGSDNSYLLQKVDLKNAESWRDDGPKKKEDLITPLHAQYITASRNHAIRNQRIISGSLTIVSIVLTALIIFGSFQYIRAQQETNDALNNLQIAQARQFAARANYYLSNDNDYASLLMSSYAYQLRDTYETKDSLLAALEYQPPIMKYLRDDGFAERKSPVSAVAFTPDLHSLLSADQIYSNSSGGVTSWDLATGQPHDLFLTSDYLADTINSMSVNPKGSVFATAGGNGVWLWSMSGTPIIALTRISSTLVLFSPDGNFLVADVCAQNRGNSPGSQHAACEKWQLLFWNISDKNKWSFPQVFPQAGQIVSLAFSPTKRVLFAGDSQGSIQMWNVDQGTQIAQMATNHPGPVWSMAFSPDGKYFAFGSDDGVISVHDLQTNTSSEFRGHTKRVKGLAFSPDSNLLASGSQDSTVRLWNLANGESNVYTGHHGEVECVAFSSDSRFIASGDEFHRIIYWHIGALTSVPVSRRLYNGAPVNSVAFSPDGTTIISGDANGTLALWNLARLSQITQFPPRSAKTSNAAIVSVSYASDGKLAVAGFADGLINLWDIATRSQVGSLHYRGALTKIAFDPGFDLLAASGDEGTMVWDMGDISNIRLVHMWGSPTGRISKINSVAFSQDGQLLATGGEDKLVTLWNVETGKIVGRPMSITQQDETIDDVVFSSDNRIAFIGSHGSTEIRHVPDGKYITQISDPDSTIHHRSIAFSPDSKLFAYVVLGTDVSLADLNRSVSPNIARPMTHSGVVNTITFSPDNTLLASADVDGFITLTATSPAIWQMYACDKANRNLSLDEWNYVSQGQPYQKICPDLPMNKQVINDVFSQAQADVTAGKRDDAETKYKQVTDWVTHTDDARFNNGVCRTGSVDGFAQVVMPACQRALVLEPDNGFIHDTRGIARALSGDTNGAIQDFNFFIQWYQTYALNHSVDYISKRNTWIKELRAGVNPFNAKTLAPLRTTY